MGEWTIRRFTVYKAISVVPLPKRNTETQRRNGSNCFWIEKTLSHLSLVKPCSVFVSLMPWHSQKQNRTQLHILVEILWEEPWLLYSVLDAKYSKNTVKANSNYITDQWLKDMYSKFLFNIFFWQHKLGNYCIYQPGFVLRNSQVEKWSGKFNPSLWFSSWKKITCFLGQFMYIARLI